MANWQLLKDLNAHLAPLWTLHFAGATTGFSPELDLIVKVIGINGPIATINRKICYRTRQRLSFPQHGVPFICIILTWN